MKRLRAIIHGRVQAVSFRYYTQRTARQLGVVGYARNQVDGTVLVVAEGAEEALKRLSVWLWEGSPAARVSRVEEEFSEGTGEFRRFEVRY